MAEMLRKDTSRIHVWCKETNDWRGFGMLYGTFQENMIWLLRRGERVRFDGTEVRLNTMGQLVYVYPIDYS